MISRGLSFTTRVRLRSSDRCAALRTLRIRCLVSPRSVHCAFSPSLSPPRSVHSPSALPDLFIRCPLVHVHPTPSLTSLHLSPPQLGPSSPLTSSPLPSSPPHPPLGQSYLGGLLCSADGEWPASAKSGEEYERIQAAFRRCGIELWELYGHGPAEGGKSFMWTEEHAEWEKSNPPPLEPIGEESVQAWRARENAKAAMAA